MKKARLLLLAVFAFTIIFAGNAQAQFFVVSVTVENTSDTCAWVTIYTSRILLPWTSWKAQFIKRDGYATFDIPFSQLLDPAPIPAEIQVRAEFMTNKQCSHPVVRDITAENKLINPDKALSKLAEVRSTVGGDMGGYYVSQPR